MVYTILTNESYCGRHAAFRFTYTKVKRDGVTQKHRTKGAGVPISIPPLVDVALWERVNAQLAGCQLSWSRIDDDDEPLLNKGFAVCGMCGARMVITTVVVREG
jgi:hypothetical protein